MKDYRPFEIALDQALHPAHRNTQEYKSLWYIILTALTHKTSPTRRQMWDELIVSQTGVAVPLAYAVTRYRESRGYDLCAPDDNKATNEKARYPNARRQVSVAPFAKVQEEGEIVTTKMIDKEVLASTLKVGDKFRIPAVMNEEQVVLMKDPDRIVYEQVGAINPRFYVLDQYRSVIIQVPYKGPEFGGVPVKPQHMKYYDNGVMSTTKRGPLDWKLNANQFVSVVMLSDEHCYNIVAGYLNGTPGVAKQFSRLYSMPRELLTERAARHVAFVKGTVPSAEDL